MKCCINLSNSKSRWNSLHEAHQNFIGWLSYKQPNSANPKAVHNGPINISLSAGGRGEGSHQVIKVGVTNIYREHCIHVTQRRHGPLAKLAECTPLRSRRIGFSENSPLRDIKSSYCRTWTDAAYQQVHTSTTSLWRYCSSVNRHMPALDQSIMDYFLTPIFVSIEECTRQPTQLHKRYVTTLYYVIIIVHK